jgi:hypothetical protein
MAKRRTTTVDDAVLDDQAAEALRHEIGFKLRVGKNYWRSLHMRMDYWASLYLLLDPIQQMKPLGYRRFISNEPRTAVDAALSILTRNDSFWRIDEMENPQLGADERRNIGRVERMLKGVIDEADTIFTLQGNMPFWKRVAQQALIRGWVWGKGHVTATALNYRDSPLVPVIYDARTVYPHFDEWGLDYVLIETVSTIGNFATNYPETFGEYLTSQTDPNGPAVKIEYWQNDRPGRPGVTGVLGIVHVAPQETLAQQINIGAFYDNPLADNIGSARWIIHPYYHGYTPEQLPVVGVPVNGLSLESKPAISPLLASRLEERADLLSLQTQAWTGPGTWQADSGRSILSAVEDQVPQYNELVATIFHHFSLSAFGTWVFKTPTGEIPNFTPGIEAKIALRPEEQVQRLEVQPINADAFRLMQIIQEEKQRGVLSNILQAAGGADLNSGVLFQQLSNAALNSLEPYHDGMEKFGMLFGTHLIEQIKAAAPALRPFEVTVQTRSRSYFRFEFDPKEDLEDRKYKPVPVFKPALPDDLAVRINAARFALDPRRPILSLKYVLENILQVDDAQGEIDAMWEDLANSDPIIVLEQISAALERMGEYDIADRIRQQEFKARFVEDAQWRQMTGSLPGLQQGSQQVNAMPPEAGGGEFNARQTGQGDEGALAQHGAAILGAMGERGGI